MSQQLTPLYSTLVPSFLTFQYTGNHGMYNIFRAVDSHFQIASDGFNIILFGHDGYVVQNVMSHEISTFLTQNQPKAEVPLPKEITTFVGHIYEASQNPSDHTIGNLVKFAFQNKMIPDNKVVKAGDGYEYYFYDESQCLWLKLDEDGFTYSTMGHISTQVKNLKAELVQKKDETIDTVQKTKLSNLITSVGKLLEKVSSAVIMKRTLKLIASSIFEEDFLKLLDNSKDNGHLLPIADNKVINLKTLAITQRTREHYFTKTLSWKYIPNCQYGLWDQVLRKIIRNDVIRSFFQVLVGYGITAEMKEKIIINVIGKADSGKSMIFRLLTSALNGFFVIGNNKLLVKGANNGNTATHQLNLIADRNPRSAQIPECGELHMDEQQSKNLIGEDEQQARKNYKGACFIRWVVKLWLHQNEMPIIDNPTADLMKKFIYITFDSLFTDNVKEDDYIEGIFKKNQDEALLKSPENLELIFNWAVQGAFQYYNYGLQIPEEVRRGTSELINQLDNVEQFVKERVEKIDHVIYNKEGVHKPTMFDYYNQWIGAKKANGENVGTKIKKGVFFQRMIDLGFEIGKANGGLEHFINARMKEERPPVGMPGFNPINQGSSSIVGFIKPKQPVVQSKPIVNGYDLLKEKQLQEALNKIDVSKQLEEQKEKEKEEKEKLATMINLFKNSIDMIRNVNPDISEEKALQLLIDSKYDPQEALSKIYV